MRLQSHNILSQSEIAALEAGLPKLSEWSDQLLVPFEARKLRNISVILINRRWFIERGFDLLNPDGCGSQS